MKNFLPKSAFQFFSFKTSDLVKRITLILTWTFLCSYVHAADDNFYLGTGKSGAITVNSGNTVINSYCVINIAAPAGQNFVRVDNTTGFAVGDIVMVWQTTQIASPPNASSSAATDLASEITGRWEFARVSGLLANRLTFSTNLKYGYYATGAQAVRVPEYSSMTINSMGSIVAQPWNGSTGGILAFLATSTVTNNGAILANGKGFRGGVYNNDPAATTGGTSLDAAPPVAGQKGEGIVPSRYGATFGGRGSMTNGGGGGSGFKSGGGGGGHTGAGGIGGNSDLTSDENRSVGGYGGGTLQYDPVFRLLMGGGGGAGHGSNGTGAAGGAGGGIIFFRANALAGTGLINASGASALTSSTDAGSGGGAGGSIYLRLAGSAVCTSLSVEGGNGGSTTTASIGPGGGGGGGKILFQSASGTCNSASWSMTGGIAGSQSEPSAPGGLAYGATNGSDGSATALTGGLTLLSATITAPASGAALETTKPTFTGTVTPGSTVRLIIDGVVTYSPTPDVNGNYSYELTSPQALANGAHTVQAIADYQGLSSVAVEHNFSTNVTLPVKIVSFAARLESETVQLNWDVVSETGVDAYAVERSNDGRRFYEISRIATSGSDQERAVYTAVDTSPLHGINIYRLKVLDTDGSVAYSRQIVQDVDRGFSAILSPNPFTSIATFKVDAVDDRGGSISLISSNGKVLRSYLVPKGNKSWQITIQKGQLPSGIYFLNLSDVSGRHLSSTKVAVE